MPGLQPEKFDLGLPLVHLLPIIIVLGGAALGVLLEAFVSRKARWTTQAIYTPIVILGALVALIYSGMELFDVPEGESAGMLMAREELILDPMAYAGQVVLVLIGLLAVLVMIDRTALRDGAFAGQPSDRPGSYEEELTDRVGYQRSEILPLALFSLGGMMLFPMANSMLTMFIALEIMSLPMYALAATARRRRLLSQEAALKYFILGAFSSAFFLMGIALLYGAFATLKLTDIAVSMRMVAMVAGDASQMVTVLAVAGTALVIVGFLFKIGAAPFHAWTPDVYQGAPTPVTGYMAAGVKAAAFLALTRFLAYTAGISNDGKVVFLWAVAILTMVVGTYFGLVQQNIKRMLAYSSIAHAGFMLIAIISDQVNWVAILFYVLSYGIATIGAFAVIYLVRKTSEGGTILGEAHNIDDWSGLGKKSPLLAGSMLIFLLSFAGIPLTSGFIGKLLVFVAGVQGGLTALVVIAVIASAITAFFYFRLAGKMFFDKPAENVGIAYSTGPAMAVIVICAVATILLGVLPNLVLSFLW